MLQAISDAEVGDDVIDIDPTLREPEIATADLLGKEAAIFMPTEPCPTRSRFDCIATAEQNSFAKPIVISITMSRSLCQLSGLVAKTITGQGVLRVSDVRFDQSEMNISSAPRCYA